MFLSKIFLSSLGVFEDVSKASDFSSTCFPLHVLRAGTFARSAVAIAPFPPFLNHVGTSGLGGSRARPLMKGYLFL
jgi:hypothetical protein